ncbi:hypothetical protein MASR1M59_14620 [Melaminivora sp.]
MGPPKRRLVRSMAMCWASAGAGSGAMKAGGSASPATCASQAPLALAVAPGLGVLAQVAQHRAGFDRCELVLVAQQHQARAGGQGGEQRGHHLQVHHGGFIDDEHVHLQRPRGAAAEMPRAGPRAQERMQGARRAHALHQRGQVQIGAHLRLQRAQGVVNRLLEPRRRLARGRSQGHAQLIGLGSRGKQQRQKARGGVGFARAGAAGDDGEATAQRQRAGDFLPVGIGVGGRAVGGRKESIEPAARRGRVHGLHRIALGARRHLPGHGLFVLPVAAQVEQRLAVAF